MASKTSSKVSKLAKSIKKDNAAFKRMSAAQKRVAIAEDVIAGLEAKRFRATSGTYIEAKLKGDDELQKKIAAASDSTEPNAYYNVCQEQVQLQDVLAEQMTSCNVCAKGAMFIAAVEKFDKLKVSTDKAADGNALEGFNDNDDLCDHLSSYFSQEQLDLIEFAFEGDYLGNPGNSPADEDETVAALYQYKYKNHTERMIAIMKNIIKNNGKFVCTVKAGV